MNVILLKGIVGSKAYGLDTEESDTDYLGVHMDSLPEVMSLGYTSNSIVRHDPDYTSHELAKFLGLAAKVNPTVTELLWLDSYEIKAFCGYDLIKIREDFLSEPYVRNAYSGYAEGQRKRLFARGDSFSSSTRSRTLKHARHVARLLIQGKELLETGKLSVRLNKAQIDICREMSQLAVDDVQGFSSYFTELDNALRHQRSVLPPRPNMDSINHLLLKARLGNLIHI